MWATFVCNVLPFVTLLVFIGGLIYNIRKMGKTAATGIKFTVFPASQSYVKDVVKDITLFPTIFALNKRLWLLAWPFHLSLVLLFFGHWRVFGDYGWLWRTLNLSTEQVDALSASLGMAAGIIFFLTVVFLLLRRFSAVMRNLSVLEDYVLLLLLVGIGITGNIMRASGSIDLDETRRFFSQLFTFHLPAPLDNPMFQAHFLLAQLLLIYFPFSKLMHAVNWYWTLKFKRS